MSHRFTWGEKAIVARTGEVVSIVAVIEAPHGYSYDVVADTTGWHTTIPEERLDRLHTNVVHLRPIIRTVQ